MQTKDHLERVAFEAVLDLARDGVVYAEIRFAPELHLEGGLTLHEVVEAVLEGFTRGMHDAEIEGHAIIVRAILSAMRQASLSETIAELAVEFRDRASAASISRDPRTASRPRITCARFISCSVRIST